MTLNLPLDGLVGDLADLGCLVAMAAVAVLAAMVVKGVSRSFISFLLSFAGLGHSFMMRSSDSDLRSFAFAPASVSFSFDTFSDRCDCRDSLRGLLFTGMDDMRKGMMGGCCESKLLRLGLRCLWDGREEDAVLE